MNNALSSKHKIPPGLCGTPTETKVTLQDINTKALIDTGSTVSTPCVPHIYIYNMWSVYKLLVYYILA
jgi:hypothetical protein